MLKGQKLREARDRRGLSQERLAEMVGISQNYLSRLETGERTPSMKVMGALARALSIPVGRIFEISDPPLPPVPKSTAGGTQRQEAEAQA